MDYKKILLAVIIGLALPLSALATSTIPWITPNVSDGYIKPNLINGVFPDLWTQNILPMTDSAYYLGTTTPSVKAWLSVIADSFYDTDASDGCAEWSSGVLTSLGVDCGAGNLATTTPWTTGDLVQVTNNGTVNSVATSTLGLPVFSDLLWELLNGSSVTPKDDKNVCIGECTATTTTNQLEVQGGMAITNLGGSWVYDVLDYAGLGMFFLPRITPTEPSLGNYGIWDGVLLVTEPEANNAGFCSGVTNPMLILSNDAVSSPLCFEWDFGSSILKILGTNGGMSIDGYIFPQGYLDSDGDQAVGDQLLQCNGLGCDFVNTSALGSKWTIDTTNGVNIHPATALGVTSLSIGKTIQAVGNVIDVIGGSINNTTATSSYQIADNTVLSKCDGTFTNNCVGGAGNLTMTGITNNLFGAQAGEAITTGSANVVIGDGTLIGNTTGSENVVIGREAGRTATILEGSVLVGVDSGYSIASSTDTVGIGRDSLYNATTSPRSTCIGVNACKGAFTYGDVGANTADENVAVGYNALQGLQTDARRNTAIGAHAGYTATGDYNFYGGYEAGYLNFTGNENVYLGYQAGYGGSGNSASQNVAIGYQPLHSITTGLGNVALGAQALRSNTTGNSNFALGENALDGNTVGSENTGLGVTALFKNRTGSENVAIGSAASTFNTSATGTIAIGNNAARGTADYNNQYGVYIGYNAGYSAQTGSNNNNFLGYRAGYSNTTGANNLFLGYSVADSLSTGSNNIGIGYDIEMPSNTGSNQLNIGNLIFGTGVDGTGTTLSTGNIGIGTTTPFSKFHITSGASATTTVTYGSVGDTTSKVCHNTKNTAGSDISFYFVGTTMVIENNKCN